MTKNNCVYNGADEFEVPMKQIKDTVLLWEGD